MIKYLMLAASCLLLLVQDGKQSDQAPTPVTVREQDDPIPTTEGGALGQAREWADTGANFALLGLITFLVTKFLPSQQQRADTQALTMMAEYAKQREADRVATREAAAAFQLALDKVILASQTATSSLVTTQENQIKVLISVFEGQQKAAKG